MSAAPELRPYQLASLEAIADAREKGTNRVLIKKPTGTGKTVTFAAMLKHQRIARWLEELPKGKGARMLVIAHREELLDQAAAKIQAANPGVMVSIEQGDRYANKYSDVIIASIQTLSASKYRRLLRLLELHTFRLVIIDEAHHAAAPTYRNVLVHLGFLPPADLTESTETEAANFDDVAKMAQALEGWDARAPKDRLLVGVTATPNRSDAIGLGCVFQTIAYSYNLKDAIEDRWLVPIKPWVIETAESLDDVRIARGDFNQKDLAEAVNNERRNKLALDAWRMYAGELQTIGFTVDVAHAHACAELWQRDGIAAAAVSGETPKDERRQILRDYTAGKIRVIFNCMVLTEGTDLPVTGCILHLKPTKSATLYEQMTGRGLRLFPGKTECVVIDLVDIARRHSLQAAPVLYGLPPGLKAKGDDLRKLENELEAFKEKYPQFDLDAMQGRFSMKDLLDRASTFDIWTVPEMGTYGEGLSMNWIRVGDETFRLQYPWQDGTETLTVQKDLLGHYDLVATLRERIGADGYQPATRQRTLAAQVPTAHGALILAEAFVAQERRSVMKLKDREAPWRQGAASDKQLSMLRRMKIPHNPKTVTKGQASDLIDLAMSRRAR